jgi:hypothetical protein
MELNAEVAIICGVEAKLLLAKSVGAGYDHAQQFHDHLFVSRLRTWPSL